jgi:hypothetical protein
MSYTESNDASRARLEAFVRGLTDEALRRPAPYGGTVAGLLAHLAFWERRVTVLLQRWQAGGVDESPVDPDMINDALVPFWAALEPRAAAELCLQAAAEADAEVAALSPELTAAVEQAMAEGKVFMRLDRSLHRLGHLADLEPIIRGS